MEPATPKIEKKRKKNKNSLECTHCEYTICNPINIWKKKKKRTHCQTSNISHTLIGNTLLIIHIWLAHHILALGELRTCTYNQTSNISCTLVGNKTVDNSDVVGASTVSAAQNYIFILNLTPGFNGLGKGNCKMRWETFKVLDLVCLIPEVWWYIMFYYEHLNEPNLKARSHQPWY